jgi:hypothetical protein
VVLVKASRATGLERVASALLELGSDTAATVEGSVEGAVGRTPAGGTPPR